MSDDPYKAPEHDNTPKRQTSATIYWSRRAIPELSGLSRAEQKAVWNACSRKAITGWKWWVSMGIAAATGVGVMHFGRFLLEKSWNADQTLSLLIGSLMFVFGLVVVVVGMTILQIRFMRPYLREYLNDRESGE